MLRFGGLAAAVSVLQLLGCGVSDDRPLGPGGGGGGTNPVPRADASAGQARATGHLCEVSSFLDVGPCKPLINSGLSLSTYTTLSVVADDGSFDVEIEGVQGVEGVDGTHVPFYAVSSQDWFGGSVWVDAVEGEDLSDIEVPVLARATVEEILSVSGTPTLLSGDSIVAILATNPAGVPLSDVFFTDIGLVDPYVGGPSAYSPGSTTTATGSALFVGIGPNTSGVEIQYIDASGTGAAHSVLGPDTFTIVPLVLNR